MSDDAYLIGLTAELAEAESRLKLATATADWRAAVTYATKAVELEERIAVAKLGPAQEPAETNIVGRPKVHG